MQYLSELGVACIVKDKGSPNHNRVQTKSRPLREFPLAIIGLVWH